MQIKLKSFTCKEKRGLLLLSFFFICNNIFSQAFTPIQVTGFNHDVIAESGTSSLTTTTIPLDGATVSNKVMYTNTFRVTNGFAGGGIPDNGVITDAAGSYQLASYTISNALLLQRAQTGVLTLPVPSRYNSIRILCFSTEGTSLINVQLSFGANPGYTTNVLTNYALSDWFNNTGNLVLSGFGRCTRSTPASGADAFPDNPRLYYIDIPLNCVDKQNFLTKISITNVTTAGNNAPYPNAVFFAVSGIKNISSWNILGGSATCTTNGSATITLINYPTPASISWGTNPVQTGNTATNIPPGLYQITVTDANGCVTFIPFECHLFNHLTIISIDDTTICLGSSFSTNITSNADTFAWSPTAGVSNPNILNPVLSPSVTTVYTITGTTGYCTKFKSIVVTVLQPATLTVHNDTTICSGASFNATSVSNGTAFTWSPTAGVSNPSIANPVLSPTITTTYTVTAKSGNCSSISKTFTVTVLPAVLVSVGPGASIFDGSSVQLQGSGSAGIYLWTPATGLSATNILNPVATPLVTTNYNLKITNAQGCSNSANVSIIVIPYCINPMKAFTPNNDGFNEIWYINTGNCLKKAKVQVFNRYGEKVFESADYKNDWNGTYKNKPLPDGTYYYVIDYELINNTRVFKKGDVTILR